MKTTKEKSSVSQGKKRMPLKAKARPAKVQNNDEEISPYVDLDKANFTERPYHRPSSLGPDHEPGVIE